MKRPSAVAALLIAALVGACGREATPRRFSDPATRVAAADTVELVANGARIVVPAPEGMVDMLTVLNSRAPVGSYGTRFEGLFVPRDRVPVILAGGKPHDLTVAVSVSAANTSDDNENMRRFEAMQSRQLAHRPWLADSTSRPIATALERWRAGRQEELDDPLARHPGDTLLVASESHDLRSYQILGVGRDPTASAGEYDLVSSAWVLVRGRILELIWLRRVPFSVATLAQAMDDLRRWIDAVLEANP